MVFIPKKIEQRTLFGHSSKTEEKAEVEDNEDEENYDDEDILEDDAKDIGVDNKPITQLKKTHLCFAIRAIANSTLEGVNIHFDLSTSYEIFPYPQKYSTYGGYWGGNSFTSEQVPNMLRHIIESRKEHMKKPYVENLEDAYFFTNLKAEDITIDSDAFTIQEIEKHDNLKWDIFLTEFNAIGNNPATAENIKFAEEIKLLEKDLDTAQKKRDKAKQEMDSFFEKKQGFKQDLLQQLTPDEVYKKWILHAAECGAMEEQLTQMQERIRCSYGIV